MARNVSKRKPDAPEAQLSLFNALEAPPAKPQNKRRSRSSERTADLEKRVTALEGEFTVLREQLERECDEDWED